MPLPEDFAAEALYEPSRWYLHDLEEIDAEAGRVVGILDTTRLKSETAAQRLVGAHVRHVPGAVALQVTATLGNLHAVYILGLRPTQGWVGYGTHIKEARFPTLGEIGPPVRCELLAKRVRSLRGTTFAEYDFHYTQQERSIYRSTQIAAWAQPA